MNKLELVHLPHDTRHTFATLLSNVNANTASISKLMGHRSYDITERIYTHKDISDYKDAINKI